MKKTTKALALVLCAMLLVVGSVMGTLAYLTSQDDVTNTFTVGNVTITMDEADVDAYGVKLYKVDAEGNTTSELADRVDSNEYKLIPGHTYVKDPTIHVGENSESCWLFVKIENGLVSNGTINWPSESKWVNVEGDFWAYTEAVDADADVVVFNSFTFANVDPNSYGNAVIKVTAHAIQKDSFSDYTAAWTALKTELSNE